MDLVDAVTKGDVAATKKLVQIHNIDLTAKMEYNRDNPLGGITYSDINGFSRTGDHFFCLPLSLLGIATASENESMLNYMASEWSKKLGQEYTNQVLVSVRSELEQRVKESAEEMLTLRRNLREGEVDPQVMKLWRNQLSKNNYEKLLRQLKFLESHLKRIDSTTGSAHSTKSIESHV